MPDAHAPVPTDDPNPARCRRWRVRFGLAPLCLLSGLTPALGAMIELPPATVVGCGRIAIEDGRWLQFPGIELPPAAQDDAASPLGAACRVMLSQVLTPGRPLRALPIGADRHGGFAAELLVAGTARLPDDLVAAGLAWVSGKGEARHAAALRALEAEARTAGRGLWAVPQLGELPADAVVPTPPRFAVVRGMVREVAFRGGTTYLNFGKDWRTDFTVAIDEDCRTRLRRAGIDLAGLTGKSVRARGWLTNVNGPMMEISEPAQLEVLP